MNVPSPTPRGQPLFGEAWKCVRTWPGLAAEPKLAWLTVVTLAGGHLDRTIKVSPTAIGADQGARDPLRSGIRYLTTLANHGLVDCLPGPGKHEPWSVHAYDPVAILAARHARLREIDPQGELPFDPATVAQLPPDVGKTTLTLDLSRSARAEYQPPEKPGAGDSCATAADPQLAAFSIGLVQGRAQGSLERRPEEAERLAAKIAHMVDDPKLSKAIVARVAVEILQGLWPENQLHDILRRTRPLPTTERRGQYFIAAVKRSFQKYGIPWREGRDASQTKPETSMGAQPPEQAG